MGIIADRLASMRQKHGLTQEELAELAEISQNSISRYERNLTDPTSEVIVKLAKALATSSDYLLGMTDNSTLNLKSEDLETKEQEVITQWRRGNPAQAAKIILNGY